MKKELIDRILTVLVPEGFEDRSIYDHQYKARNLPGSALVTRLAPSPTGFVHLGTIYTALLCERLAHQSGGVYILRIEDTDKKREVENGVMLIENALGEFDLTPDESPKMGGKYGPYIQSERKAIYLSFAASLLLKGRAYPCFATPEELEKNYKLQQASKIRPGYYGEWAIWRSKSEQEINQALDEGLPFVLRFRSNGSHLKRITFDDLLKGHLELPENDLDVPLIKADGSQLPTYHLAHLIDDYLMKANLVLRGDEWLPSTPLHLELADALEFKPSSYAHFAPISILDNDGGGKRKLSKRKDKEANIEFFQLKGYPLEPMRMYLLGIANSDYEQWQKDNPKSSWSEFKVTLERLAKSRSPLYDQTKLNDYSKNYIASLPQDEFEKNIIVWCEQYGSKYCQSSGIVVGAGSIIIKQDAEYISAFLKIERQGEKVRKDVAKWSDVIENYGYFADELFTNMFEPRIETELADLDSTIILKLCSEFLETYNHVDDQISWFEKLKSAAERCNFSLDNKVYKSAPEKFSGSLSDAAKIIRVKLTGKNRTPDLWSVMQVMGLERVKKRLTLEKI